MLVFLVDHDCEESLHLEGILEFFAENQPDAAFAKSLQGLEIPEGYELLRDDEYTEQMIKDIDNITKMLANQQLGGNGNFRFI